MGRLLDAGISALGAVVAVGFVFAASWVNAYGPDALAHSYAGTVVHLVLWLWAGAIVLFGSFRHVQRIALALVSFLALGVAWFGMESAVADSVFQQRGQLTTCVIVSVDKRESTHTDSDGQVDTTTYYVNELSCAVAQVHEVTTGEPAGLPRERITVRYDPRGRLQPVLPSTAPDPDFALWVCAIALSLAVLARVGSEARGVDPAEIPFGPGGRGLSRVRHSAVVLAIGACFAVAVMAGWRAVWWFKDAALGWFGTDRRELGRHWWHLLVDIPFLAGYAAAFVIAVLLVRAFWLWLLRAASWLDPGAAVLGPLSEMGISNRGSAGGLSFYFGGGLVQAIWSDFTASRRRRRRRRRPGSRF